MTDHSSQSERRRGFSLVEIMVVLAVMAVVISFGVPRFARSAEQSRADVAGANLRAIWAAQRLYWLDNRTYAPDLATLAAPDVALLDPAVVSSSSPYVYQITTATTTGFTATATRAAGTSWAGAFTVDDTGAVSGSVQSDGQADIVPGFL